MKIKFSTEELKKRLAQIGNVVAKKASVPVFGFVRLYSVAAEDKSLSVGLVGMDIDSSLTVTLTKALADAEIDVLLPYAKLLEIVNNVSAADCFIETPDETKATFKAGKYKAELKTHPLGNWPVLLERPESAIATVGLPGLKEQISQVDFAVPANDGKHVVSVARVESTPETLRLVATDGFRLAISSATCNAGEFTLTLPKPALELIKKLDGGAQLTISEADGGFYFETELESLTVSRAGGEFPKYDRVIPKSHKTEIAVDKSALLEAVRRVRPLADQEKPIIVFSVAENGTTLDISAASVESGSDGSVFRNMAQDDIDVKVTGPAAAFNLDANLLQPFLDKVTGPLVVRFLEVGKPVDFVAAEGNYRYLIMPYGGAAKQEEKK